MVSWRKSQVRIDCAVKFDTALLMIRMTRVAFQFALEKGLIPYWLEPDGNCFCHAINKKLFENRKTIEQIKREIVAGWEANGIDIIYLLTLFLILLDKDPAIAHFNLTLAVLPREEEVRDEATGARTLVTMAPFTPQEFRTRVYLFDSNFYFAHLLDHPIN